VLCDFSLARNVASVEDVQNETYSMAVPKNSPPESWAIGRRPFGFKTDVWGAAMAMFEILNMRSINSVPVLTELVCLKGTQAVKPRKLLLDDIAIDDSFTRENRLWFLMSKCWYKNPLSRPQIWEVEEVLRDFCDNPLPQEEYYISNYVSSNENETEDSEKQSFDCKYDSFGRNEMCDILLNEFSMCESTPSNGFGELLEF
jgi:hypothetical protein